MSEPLGDDVGTLALGDEQGDVDVAEVMGTHRLTHRQTRGRVPDRR